MQNQKNSAKKPNTFLVNSAKQISTILTNNLAQTKVLSTSVQGFNEYNFLGYPCRNPLQLNNILGPTFWRVFHPVLVSAIEEIKTSGEIDKNKLHAALLEKYLGIHDLAKDFVISNEPNAYHTVPNENQVDYLLHLNFLQPNRLFGITQENRKIKGTNLSKVNREWLWHPDGKNNDSAPLFREIIQIYILGSIIDDCEDPQTDPLFKNDVIINQLDKLKLIHQKLLQDIQDQTRVLIQANDKNIKNTGAKFSGNPRGFYSNSSTFNFLDHQFPGFMDMASLYPIGRLMFGQPTIEPHHASASLSTSQGKMAYAFAWLFEHLNISTSFFWLKTAFSICVKMWRVFKQYVTNPNATFHSLFEQSLLFIPNALILVSAPLLILLPAIYGLTTIPFTLVRTFCMHSSWQSLKSFNLLKGLDVLEFLKDCFLFFAYALPILNITVDIAISFLPGFVLTAGFCTAWALTLICLLFLSINTSYLGLIFRDVSAIASTAYMQFFGAMVFVGMVAYLGLGIVGRAVFPYIPQFIFDGLNRLLVPFNGALDAIEKLVRKWVGEAKINLNNIIPQSELQVPFEIPKAQVKVVVPEQMLKEIEEVTKKLGKLNTSLHLIEARKKPIKQCMEDLDILKAPSLDSLKKALEKAKELLQNNFDPKEAQDMEKLITHLKAINKTDVQAIENVNVKMLGKDGDYQPSWKLISTLHQRGIIDEKGKWHLPEGINITPEMQKKCERIEGLKPKL